MNQKPDETLDQWVQQTLGQLPDTPPPDSSFNAERLWTQLRPELQTEPPRQKIGWVWWLAAACLSGFTLSWFWLYQSPKEPSAVAKHGNIHKADTPVSTYPAPNFADRIATRKPVFSEKEKPKSALQIRTTQKEKPKVDSIEVIDQNPVLPIVETIPPAAEKPTERSELNVTAIAPKRQFRIVHENELRAEEEARSKLYRTEHFVRLGSGSSKDPIPGEPHHILLIPLTRTSN